MDESAKRADWGVSGFAHLFDAVLTAAGQERDLTDSNREHFAETGAAAFAAGMSLSGLIGTYLGGAAEVWEHVFSSTDSSRAVERSRVLRQLSEQALSSLAEGFEAAQRLSIRAEESLRRTFLDDLLSLEADPVRLATVAAQLDIPGFSHVTVAVASSDRHVTDAGPLHRRTRTELESLAPKRQLLVTAKEGRMVVIGLDADPHVLSSLMPQALANVADVQWRVGVGSRSLNLESIARSYQEALEALRIGTTFGLPSPVEFARILPQRLLSADMSTAEALVDSVLGPLSKKPSAELLLTLESFIEHGGNMAEVARHLNIGARTVAYRLDRIEQITGCSPRVPEERFVLELAYRAAPLVEAKRRRRPT